MKERNSPERPSDDEDQTWHVHDDGTWDWGATCLVCIVEIPQMGGDMPYFNIARLQADNAGHYTQRELGKEITDAARSDDRDIMKA